MIKPGRYLHYKGNYYRVLNTVQHSESLEVLVLYRSEKNDQLWVRPLAMFTEEVCINGKNIPRFQWIESAPN
jgi:hypothetical protein